MRATANPIGETATGPTGRDPNTLEAPDLEATYWTETEFVLRHRLRLAVLLFLPFLLTGVVVEVIRRPQHATVTLLTLAAEMLACGAILLALNVAGPRRCATALSVLLGLLVVLLLSVNTALTRGPIERLGMAEITLLSSLVVLLPWGWRPQLVVVVGALVGFAVAAPVAVSVGGLALPGLTLLAGATVSVFGARYLHGYRYEAFVRTNLLAHASAVKQEEAEVSEVLLHVGETLSAGVPEANLPARVTEVAVTTLGCDWSAIYTFDAERQAYRPSAASGMSAPVLAEFRQVEFARTSFPLLQAFRPGRLIELADTRHQALMPPELLARIEAASVLYAPISRGETILGFLAAAYRARTGTFSPRQRRLGLGIAHAAAIALENARLITDLQTASRLKSEFVATMSHELRTPINVILGYADLLRDGTFGGLGDAQDETLGRLRRAAVELLELVNATLDVGRLDAGRERIMLGPVSLEGLFKEVGRELEPLVQPAVKLTWANTLGSQPILADRTKLKTIVKNLIANALKFTPTGVVEVTARAGGLRQLVIRVRDTGVGIREEHLPVIFEMFRQGDASPTRRFGGVGLGLHIVKRLVDLTGGTITVESTLGQGSTFTVTLPAAGLTQGQAAA
ncbi:MAG: HAMP domain-containing sensor histidine kinase [Candidatus Binatia bacterium]